MTLGYIRSFIQICTHCASILDEPGPLTVHYLCVHALPAKYLAGCLIPCHHQFGILVLCDLTHCEGL